MLFSEYTSEKSSLYYAIIFTDVVHFVLMSSPASDDDPTADLRHALRL